MRVLKYLLLAFAILLLGLIIAAAVGIHYLRGVPHFYKTYRWANATERSIVSQRALDKLLQTQSMAARAYSHEALAAHGKPTSRPVEDPVTVSFTEEEVNAFIAHNSEVFQAFTEKYQEYLKDPGVFFHDRYIILAGEASGYVISFYLEPSIDPNGQLHLELVKTTGGRLSIPKSFIDAQLGKLKSVVEAKMPKWQSEAKMDAAGAANSSMVAAAMGKLLLCALSDKPAPAVLFIQVDSRGKKMMPVKIESLKVQDESLTLKLAPMDKAQRSKMFAEITR